MSAATPAPTSTLAPTPPPFLDIRCRGARLVVQDIPYRLITLVTTVSGIVAGGIWLPR
ncbi:hypothetical protein [Streptomyces sp. NPDC059491]|uniref:hypothetical protein n=1 Tax=Streptomyces sp. NPDC059491 TaxID=3346850 RepID=UPI0036A251AC